MLRECLRILKVAEWIPWLSVQRTSGMTLLGLESMALRNSTRLSRYRTPQRFVTTVSTVDDCLKSHSSSRGVAEDNPGATGEPCPLRSGVVRPDLLGVPPLLGAMVSRSGPHE